MSDIVRRVQGHAFEALGLGPSECPYRITASGPFLAASRVPHPRYSINGVDHCSADQAPLRLGPVSLNKAIRYCMQQSVHVRLLEWLPASEATGNNGLGEYAEAIRRCIAKISGEDEQATPFLFGHSLGGTLAAIFGALAPEAIRGLVLLGAPLCFRPATSRFRDALVSLVPSGLSDAEPCPGSLLSCVSALASPDTLTWSRVADAALSLADGHALETHARVRFGLR